MFGRRPNQTEATPTPADMVEANSTGGQELESLWEPSQVRQKKAIEQILLERGNVTEEQLDFTMTLSPGVQAAGLRLRF